MSSTVLFVGATSKVGAVAVPLLLEQGRSVRAMTRDAARAGALARLGAEVVEGDLRDRDSLRRACRGVAQVVASAHAATGGDGNNPRSVDGQGNRELIDAAREAAVRQVVYVSARTSEAAREIDFFRIKHETEAYLVGSGLGYTVLRAGPFMETWAEILGQSIANKGKAVVFGRGDVPINFISARDVGRFVMLALDNGSFRDRVIELGGPQDLTLLDVVAAFEQACGRKARRFHLPVPLMRAARMLSRPFSPVAHRMLGAGLLMATRPDPFHPDEPREGFLTGRTRLAEVAASRFAATIRP